MVCDYDWMRTVYTTEIIKSSRRKTLTKLITLKFSFPTLLNYNSGQLTIQE